MARRPSFPVVRTGLILLVFALSGCATYNTAQHIRPWGDGAHGFDQVDEVTAAWREPNGDIRVCVRGDPAERGHSTAMLFKEVDYSVVLPAGLFETGPESAPALQRTKDPVPEFNLTAARVQGRCPDGGGGRTAIPVRRVLPAELGVESFAFADDADRETLFMAGAGGPVVFEFVETPSSSLYFRAGAPVFDGSRVVEIDLALREKEPRPAWILVMPFALLFDLVTSPFQIALCEYTPNGCPIG